MQPLPELVNRLADLEHDLLLRQRRVVQPLADGRCLVDRRTLWQCAGNDYLALTQHPHVLDLARQALDEFGAFGAGASALISGYSPWHARLEVALAQFEGEEAALLFPTGTAANQGVLAALVSPDDVIFCDRLNHASLVDGCRLTRAQFRVYRHDDLERFADELRAASSAQQRWIVTDGVFSMDGDLAPLPDLCDLAEKFNARVIVDEAHGTGVFGATGRGVTEHFNVESRVSVRVGTLSKALGSLGGFVAGSRDLIRWLENKARTQIYSTALPAVCCAAALGALEVLQQEPDRRTHLHALAASLRTALADLITPGVVGPIIPVILETSARAIAVGQALDAAGYLVGVIRPPTVPQRTARLRISLSSALDETTVFGLANTIRQVISQVDAESV